MPPRSNRLMITMLVLSSIALAAILAFQLLHPPELNKIEAIRSNDPVLDIGAEETSLEHIKIAAADRYSEIVERPLFLESRKPPAPDARPAPIQAPVQEEDDKTFTLIGVMVTTEATTALLQVNETGKIVRLRPGEKVENWQLNSVDADFVTLRKGQKNKKLELVRNKERPRPTVNTTNKTIEERRKLLQQRREAILRRQAAQTNAAPTESSFK